MARVTCDQTVSLDGYSAGPDQSHEEPLGVGGESLHRWMFERPEENSEERAAITVAGAYVMGRNMFGPPEGGDWDPDWSGWWGDDPPYHAPVFVLTHFPREPIEMEGGTTFNFVTAGIEAAMAAAHETAGEREVSVAGGASTVNQCLAIGAIDELRLHIAPIVLGAGERIFEGIGDPGLEPVASRATELATHITYRRRPDAA